MKCDASFLARWEFCYKNICNKMVSMRNVILRRRKVIILLIIGLLPILWYLNSDTRIVWNLNLTLDEDGWSPDGPRAYNITGWPTDIVPDIVHYILFEYHRISYSNMLSLMSVIRIHQPALIYIHCDCDAIELGDANFARVLAAVNETDKTTIHIHRIERPTEINGLKIREEHLNFHGSDIMRYRLMKQYGGIYVDNDVFVCQSLHRFRKFEFTLNWDEGQSLGSQVLIGHKDARFLRLVLQTYKVYDTNRWYWNAGELPTVAVLEKFPQIVHRIKVKFGVDAPVACKYFYKEYHGDWRTEYYTFHMAMRGDHIQHKEWCLGENNHPLKHTVFTDNVIRTLDNTFGEMARNVLWPTKNSRFQPEVPQNSIT